MLRYQVSDHLKKMRDFLNTIGSRYDMPMEVFDAAFLHGGPKALLDVLKRGISAPT